MGEFDMSAGRQRSALALQACAGERGHGWDL